MAGYLTPAQLTELEDAATSSGLIFRARMQLFRGIRPTFVGFLNLDPAPRDQFRLDLSTLNTVEKLEDGTIPLELYLANAAEVIKDLSEARVFQKYQNAVSNLAAGVKDLQIVATLPALVTNKEAIIHQDDSVDMSFVQDCLTSAKSVAKLLVPRFDNGIQKKVNGAPWLFNGTGWLLATDLLITNHHVINSRRDDEAAASAADFDLQGRSTSVVFDYNNENDSTVAVGITRVEVSNQNLDYCILRLAAPVSRNALVLSDQAIVITPATYLALNIIQHPQGKAKRVALRNNLAVDADADVVRYYTDTDYGSSGSPVCDDRWKVVALHRGAMLQAAKFQGKDTAFVNVGSQITRIIQQLKTDVPALSAELGV